MNILISKNCGKVKFVWENDGNSGRLYFLGVHNDCGW